MNESGGAVQLEAVQKLSCKKFIAFINGKISEVINRKKPGVVK